MDTSVQQSRNHFENALNCAGFATPKRRRSGVAIGVHRCHRKAIQNSGSQFGPILELCATLRFQPLLLHQQEPGIYSPRYRSSLHSSHQHLALYKRQQVRSTNQRLRHRACNTIRAIWIRERSFSAMISRGSRAGGHNNHSRQAPILSTATGPTSSTRLARSKRSRVRHISPLRATFRSPPSRRSHPMQARRRQSGSHVEVRPLQPGRFVTSSISTEMGVGRSNVGSGSSRR